ncbi:hypothetical protein [Streptomyces sp. C10-9-1]|uniref:hypothetical protein n=1 Tax=Streptomyces sp. C10-9-1 TaxID=1859285 RepID=UPI00273A6080|nr:hypothetical protein [Streptomyces sp. C10-9-1]
MKRITRSLAACAVALGALTGALPAHAAPSADPVRCGGLGETAALRLDGRTAGRAVTLAAGRPSEFALDFRPARSHGATQLHVRARGAFGEAALTREAAGAVEAGRTYTVRQRVTPRAELAGSGFALRLHVTGDENTVEACVEVDVRVAG